MEHYFDLPVIYKEEELTFKVRLATFGYVYKFYIIVEGQELVFEKDEEGQYRVHAVDEKNSKDMDPGLIEAIIDTLNALSV